MISEIVDRFLLRPEDEGRAGCLHPSSLYGCQRRAIFEYMGKEETHPISPRSLRVFKMGHIAEELVLEALEMEGVLVDTQVPVARGLWSGNIDAIVEQDGKQYILELKTVHSRAFHWAAKERRRRLLGLGSSMPYDSHIFQVLAYDLLLPQPEGNPRLPPHILYISKDDLLMEEFIIQRVPHQQKVRCSLLVADHADYGLELVKEVPDILEQQMQELERYAESGTVPPVPFGDPGEHPYLCERNGKPNCQWYGHCWWGSEEDEP